MSWVPCEESLEKNQNSDFVREVIIPRSADIGGFEVHRALPSQNRRLVGPFIFWDQMGPGEFLSGHGVDVRPHPHIGLSTVTYLFKGSLDHKDSLGHDLRIFPGDINLMTAGSGIVHSERTGSDMRQNPSSLFGIQSWLAQPLAYEDTSPAFLHIGKEDLPTFREKKLQGRLILGSFEGLKSPVPTQWETLYLDVFLDAQAHLRIPGDIEERALYILSGQITIGSTMYGPQQLILLKEGVTVDLQAESPTHMMVLGGATLDGPRYIWWNFVSSSKERLEKAKEDWREGRFDKIPTDQDEFIPLPG